MDGLILAASLVLLHEARNGRGAPGLARLMLWLGIAATVGGQHRLRCQVRAARRGDLGWPAVAFIGAVEIVMQLVRRARAPHPTADEPVVAGNVEEAVRAAYAASVAAGAPLGQRAISQRFGISRRKAGQLITPVVVQSNGHVPAREVQA